MPNAVDPVPITSDHPSVPLCDEEKCGGEKYYEWIVYAYSGNTRLPRPPRVFGSWARGPTQDMRHAEETPCMLNIAYAVKI